jgi:hypothetical protein
MIGPATSVDNIALRSFLLIFITTKIIIDRCGEVMSHSTLSRRRDLGRFQPEPAHFDGVIGTLVPSRALQRLGCGRSTPRKQLGHLVQSVQMSEKLMGQMA